MTNSFDREYAPRLMSVVVAICSRTGETGETAERMQGGMSDQTGSRDEVASAPTSNIAETTAR